VRAIDDRDALQRMAVEERLASGTPQWKSVTALRAIAACGSGATATLSIDAAGRTRDVPVECDAARRTADRRPGVVAELSPGVWYMDLTRASEQDLAHGLERMVHAAAAIFDVRGYPTGAAFRVLPHLIARAESDRWMHVARITGPFGHRAGWESMGWNLTPASPTIEARAVFLTDGRAISYAESIMGYVADGKLATIVGSATAGANGNVVAFPVPGGFTIRFTGMRVTRHDGRSPHHGVGIRPDVEVQPTLAGVAAGRDEVLERALELVRAR
jgi:hypothetical protein